MSKLNCGGKNEITGAGNVHVLAGGISTVYLGCEVNIAAQNLFLRVSLLKAATRLWMLPSELLRDSVALNL
jgi:hypothetical protein